MLRSSGARSEVTLLTAWAEAAGSAALTSPPLGSAQQWTSEQATCTPREPEPALYLPGRVKGRFKCQQGLGRTLGTAMKPVLTAGRVTTGGATDTVLRIS